jgi:hypothetical protein
MMPGCRISVSRYPSQPQFSLATFSGCPVSFAHSAAHNRDPKPTILGHREGGVGGLPDTGRVAIFKTTGLLGTVWGEDGLCA